MTTTMTTPQVLRATADHLRTYGWVQGKFYDAKPVIKPTKPMRFYEDNPGPMHIETVIEQDYDHAPACMLGALGVVSGAREHLQYGGQQMMGAGPAVPPVEAYRRAVKVLEKTIAEQTRGQYRDVAGFNDDLGSLAYARKSTTLEAVLEMLEAAAQRAEHEDMRMGEMRQVMSESMATTMAAMNAMGANIITAGEALKAAFASIEPEAEPTPEVDAVMTLEEAALVVDAAVEAVSA